MLFIVLMMGGRLVLVVVLMCLVLRFVCLYILFIMLNFCGMMLNDMLRLFSSLFFICRLYWVLMLVVFMNVCGVV